MLTTMTKNKHANYMKWLFMGLMLIPLMLYGQTTQKGMVKTRGRMVNGQLVPGKGLPDATIQIKGMNNIVSRDGGNFSFKIGSNGQYQLLSVMKQGYQMVDQEACRAYKPSNNTLYIVMETPEQQRRDLREAQSKIRQNLQQQLQKREAEIMQMQVDAAKKDSLIDLLYEQQGDNEKLITDMAKRYSELDYDQMDEFYQQVSYAIEQGLLTRADSLLRSRGDLNQQVEIIIKNGQTIQKEKEKVERAEAVQKADIEEAAQRCLKYYETFLAQHKNDSAAHYITLRAQLDTTRMDWLTDAGHFLTNYTSDYARANELFNCMLRQAQSVDGGINIDVAGAYNNLALVAYKSGESEWQALEYFMKAARLAEQLKGKESIEYATCIANIGMIFGDMGIENAALRHQLEALSIREKSGTDELATSYLTLGYTYTETSDYPKALEALRKAQELMEKSGDKQSIDMANCLNQFGEIYFKQTDYPKALEYYTQALAMRKEVLGESHTDVYGSLKKMANFFRMRRDYAKALEYFQEAHTVGEQLHGEDVMLENLYLEMAYTYIKAGNNEQALEYSFKALSEMEKKKGKESVDLLDAYQAIGDSYMAMGDTTKAAEHLQRAADIRQRYVGTGQMMGMDQTNNDESRNGAAKELENRLKLLALLEGTEGHDPLDVADVCEKIGTNYTTLTDHEQSLAYQTRALEIRKQQKGEHSLEVSDSYQNLAYTYIGMGDMDKALAMAQQALDIRTDLLGPDHSSVGSIYITLGLIFRIQQDWKNLFHAFRKVADIKEKIWGPDFYDLATIYQNIAAACFYLKEYPMALDYLKRELRIEEKVLGEDHENTQNTRENIAEVEKNIKLQDALARDEYAIQGTVIDGDCAARQQGMDGVYIILEYGPWTAGDEMHFMTTLDSLRDKPKTLVVLKDGEVTSHHFENLIGINCSPKHIGKEEKQRIMEIYQQWKEEEKEKEKKK